MTNLFVIPEAMSPDEIGKRAVRDPEPELLDPRLRGDDTLCYFKF